MRLKVKEKVPAYSFVVFRLSLELLLTCYIFFLVISLILWLLSVSDASQTRKGFTTFFCFLILNVIPFCLPRKREKKT